MTISALQSFDDQRPAIPDGTGVPALPSDFPHGDSNAHTMMAVEPLKIERNDIMRWCGHYRTVSSVLRVKYGPHAGATAVYFADLDHGELRPANLAEGTMAVTVWRPNA